MPTPLPPTPKPAPSTMPMPQGNSPTNGAIIAPLVTRFDFADLFAEAATARTGIPVGRGLVKGSRAHAK